MRHNRACFSDASFPNGAIFNCLLKTDYDSKFETTFWNILEIFGAILHAKQYLVKISV